MSGGDHNDRRSDKSLSDRWRKPGKRWRREDRGRRGNRDVTTTKSEAGSSTGGRQSTERKIGSRHDPHDTDDQGYDPGGKNEPDNRPRQQEVLCKSFKINLL